LAPGGDSKKVDGNGLTPLTDEELARIYREDPSAEEARAAASELFRRYWKRVYLWCLRRTGRHETARDLAQEVLISAYRALQGFEGRCLYRTWLYTIMKHRCQRSLRRPSWTRDEETDVDRLPAAETAADSALIEEEDEETILRTIRTALEPDEQSALWLRCVERLPVDEITRRLAVPGPSGARGLLQTARRKLRAALERGPEHADKRPREKRGRGEEPHR